MAVESHQLLPQPFDMNADVSFGEAFSRIRHAWRNRELFVHAGESYQNTFVENWNIVIVIVLFYLAYYEPYASTLLDAKQFVCIVVQRIMDVIFTLDIIFQFFTPYLHQAESKAPVICEKDKRKIAMRYMAIPFSHGGAGGWFWIDVLSVLPPYLQMFCPQWVSDDSMNVLLCLLMRLLRTRHFMRLPQVAANCHKKYGLPMSVIDICKFFIITSLTCHWMACLWCLVEGKITSGPISFQTDQETWLSALISAKGDSCDPPAAQNPSCVYVLALYWAVMTLTSVGYGDISAQNSYEYALSTMCMITVGYIWAYIVSSIVLLMSTTDPFEVGFRQNTEHLSQLMAHRHLPHELQVKLRGYMHASRHVGRVTQQYAFLDNHVPPGLQREVASWSAHTHVFFREVYWARDLEKDALLDISRKMLPRAFGRPDVVALPQSVIIMVAGVAAVNGMAMSLLCRGNVWGFHDILLNSASLIRRDAPRAITFVEVLFLTKQDLFEVCQGFPKADQRIRRAQVRTAVFRAFVFEAEKRRKAAGNQRASCTISSFTKSVLDADSASPSNRSAVEDWPSAVASLRTEMGNMLGEICEIKSLISRILGCLDKKIQLL